MAEKFQEERLFNHLKISGGRRQFVVSGNITDYFFINQYYGLAGIRRALEIFIQSHKFDIGVLVDRNGTNFVTPEMEKKFADIARGVSVDPEADRQANTKTFVPKGKKPQEEKAPEPENRKQEVVKEVKNSGDSAEQLFLDHVKRVLASPLKCCIVYLNPENLWMGQPGENELRKLETILRWSTIQEGNPASISVLVVNPTRLDEFNSIADHRFPRGNYTQNLTIPPPKQSELEALLWRVACRYDLTGQVAKIAMTAYAQGMTLYNFSEKIFEFISQNPEVRNLDRIFADKSLSRTLDEMLAQLNDLIGLAELKKQVRQIVEAARMNKALEKSGRKPSNISYHMIFLGNPGTGKTMVARIIGQIFWALEIRQTQAFVEIALKDISSAYNPGEVIENMKKKIAEAAGGVLFIDEFYTFAQDNWGKKAIEVLMKEMEDKRDSMTVIMAGYARYLNDLYNINPGIQSRINTIVNFPDYSISELVSIYELNCRNEHLSLSPEAREKVIAYITSRQQRGGIGNGRGIRNLFDKTSLNRAVNKNLSQIIEAADIPNPIAFNEEESCRILTEIDSRFMGLAKVKKFFRDIYVRQKQKSMGENKPGMNNCLFIGNPGTGKTSVARYMGKLFHALGLVSEKDNFIVFDPLSDATSDCEGNYAQKVRELFNQARGGVLFIDEAYRLADNEHGRQILNQIVYLATDEQYTDVIIVMAGYPDEMTQLKKINAGIERRFPNTVVFENLGISDLKKVFYDQAAKYGYVVGDPELFDARLTSQLTRMAGKRDFGNAGTVISFFEKDVASNRAARLEKDPEADKKLLCPSDLSGLNIPQESVDDILCEINEKFIGMIAFKQQIHDLINRIRFDRRRMEVLKIASTANSVGYNICFTGNSGTGKRTMVYYMARLFCALGITDNTEVREVSGIELKGSYLGQTKDVVRTVFENNAGKVVHVRDIYKLLSDMPGHTDSYAAEAVAALEAGMSDSRNASIIFIFSGHKEPMERFWSRNALLAGRIQTFIEFADYSNAECVGILNIMVKSAGYDWYDDFEALKPELECLMEQGTANAGRVAGIFEEILKKMRVRVNKIANPGADDFRLIMAEDIPLNEGLE